MIDRMGDKASAKATMIEAVPVVPGSVGILGHSNKRRNGTSLNLPSNAQSNRWWWWKRSACRLKKRIYLSVGQCQVGIYLLLE
jgi:hypothetical protein